MSDNNWKLGTPVPLEQLEDVGQAVAASELQMNADAAQNVVRDAVIGLVPASAFHDEDLTGETWTWTTPRGTYKLMFVHLPQTSVALEFRQPHQRNDRVQFVIAIKQPTRSDVEAYLTPVLSGVL